MKSLFHQLNVIFVQDHCQMRERTLAQNLCILRVASSKVLRKLRPKIILLW